MKRFLPTRFRPSARLALTALAALVLLPALPLTGQTDAAPSVPSEWASQLIPTLSRLGHHVTLNALSCPGVGSCVAVGDYLDSKFDAQPLVETLSDGAWTATTPPPPSPGSGILTGVSCTSSTTCIAVGNYSPERRNQVPTQRNFVEKLSGGEWIVHRLSPPTGGTVLSLEGVSCADATDCVAVGSGVVNRAENLITYTHTGTTWTAGTLSVSSFVTGGQSATAALNAVSCPAAGSCVAVGSFQFLGSPTTHALVETLAGTTWTPSLPADPPHTTGAGLSGVSCVSATACEAIGSYTSRFGTGVQALGESMSGSVWTPNTSLTSGDPSSSLAGLSCTGVSACVAAGGFVDTTPSNHAGLDTLSGTGWAPTTGLDPSGTSAPGFTAVSCPAAGRCVAVGNATSAGGMQPVAAIQTAPQASAFVVTAPPAAPVGVPVTVTVTAVNAAGEVAAGYSGTVHFTSTDPAATLPPDGTLSNGSGAFSVVFRTRGTQTVTATDTANSSITGTSGPITVAMPPSAPIGLRATAGPGGIALTWSPPASSGGPPVTGYEIFRGHGPGHESQVPYASTAGTTFEDTAVVRDAPYFYMVKAVNEVGASPPSNEVSAVMASGRPGGNGPGSGGMLAFGGTGFFSCSHYQGLCAALAALGMAFAVPMFNSTLQAILNAMACTATNLSTCSLLQANSGSSRQGGASSLLANPALPVSGSAYQAASGFSEGAYLGPWLTVTGVGIGALGLLYAVRMRRKR